VTIELRPQPGPQAAAHASSADVLVYGGAAGGGKALATCTPILTTCGWRLMGDLQAGDFVFCRDGKPTEVLAAYPVMLNPTWRLTFDDGSQIDADEDHLWLTYNAKELGQLTRLDPEWRAKRRERRPSRSAVGSRTRWNHTLEHRRALSAAITARNKSRAVELAEPPSGGIRTTREITDSIRTPSGRSNHAIPVCDGVEFADAELSIDPYVFGLWLGDGCKRGGAHSCHDDDAPEIIGAFIEQGWAAKKVGKYYWSIGTVSIKERSNGRKGKINDWVRALKELGVQNNKHVPNAYLFASREQRLALLQGLLDTDGGVENGQASFTNTNKSLADAVAFLAVSLGMKATTREGVAKLDGRVIGPKWAVKFTANQQVFRLKRKADVLKLSTRRTTRFRYVVNAEYLGLRHVRCIKVAANDGLFLAGPTLIPTHNTRYLVTEPLRHVDVFGFSAVIFRRVLTNAKKAGGLWDEMTELYPLFDAYPRTHASEWLFPRGSKIHVGSIQYENTKLEWQGAQICYLAFDELSHFSESMFWYMFSRNRSKCGVRPYIRATTNPVSEDDEQAGWVNRLVSWWIDQDTGYPIAERSGVLRWFVRNSGELIWADTKEELTERFPCDCGRKEAGEDGHDPGCRYRVPKSFTFIGAKLSDNPALMRKDPDYEANLLNLPTVEQMRLYGGNWKVRATAGTFFKIGQVPIIDAVPAGIVRWCRGWDLGASEDGDPTAGVKIGVDADGRYVVADVRRGQWRPDDRIKNIKQVAELDGPRVVIRFPQDPGQAAVDQKLNFSRLLAGFNFIFLSVTKDKSTRAAPFAAQVNVGNVSLVRGKWNASFLAELDAFTGESGGRDDQVDAASDAFNWLVRGEKSKVVWPDSVTSMIGAM